MDSTKLGTKPPSEDYEQMCTVSWFRKEFPSAIMFSVPNGGYRDKRTSGMMKLTGTTAGVPDLIIIYKKEVLFVEMKRTKGGVLSESQKEFHKRILEQGFQVIVCKGYEEAKEKISEIMSEIIKKSC